MTQMMRGLRIGRWGVILGVFWVTACGKAEPPPKPASSVPLSARVENVPEVPRQEAPKEEVRPSTEYRPQGKRDPFRSLIRVPTPSEKKVLDKRLPPLQREDIKNLNLAGVVWGDFGYEALIKTPDGKGYFVRLGTLMGLNRGVVSRITDAFLVVRERHIGVLGEVRTQEVMMLLHPKKEEME